MKKRIVIFLVVLVVTIGGCIGAYFFFTKDSEELPQLPDEKEEKPTNELEGTFSSSDIILDGSTATQPLIKAFGHIL